MEFINQLGKEIDFESLYNKLDKIDFELENPKSDIDNEVVLLYEKYNTDNSLKDIKKFISKLWNSVKDIWKKLIKSAKKFLKKTEKFLKRSIMALDDRISFDYKAIFAIDYINKQMNCGIRSYKSLLSLYKRLKESLDYIIGLLSRTQKANYNQIKKFEKAIIRSNKEMIMQEANYHIFDLRIEDIYGYKSNNMYPNAVVQGEDFLNQFNIENFNVFINVNMDDILNLQTYNKNIIEGFKRGIIENIYRIVSNPDYVKIHQKLAKSNFFDNVLLSGFINKYIESPDEVKSVIRNILQHNFDIYFPPTEEGLNNIKIAVDILKRKNQAITEAYENLMKYDILAVFIAERDYWNEPLNVKKFEKRYQLDKYKVIKNDGHYLDFSKAGLGKIAIMKDSGLFEEIYHKLINIDYSSFLIYLISNFDYTVISHGSLDIYNSFRNGLSNISINKDNNNLFKECYTKQIRLCEDHLSKSFDQILDDEFNNLVMYFLKEENTLSNSDKMEFAYFYRSIFNQWSCEDVFIPELNRTLSNVEMIIYGLDKYTSINTLNLLICNNGKYIPSQYITRRRQKIDIWIANDYIF